MAAAGISAVYLIYALKSKSCSFAKVWNAKFYINNRRVIVFSANYWQAMNLGSDGPKGDRQRLLRDLDDLKIKGVNNLRIMASSEGPDGEPFRSNPSLMFDVGDYNQDLLIGLDFVLTEARKRGLTVVMCLNNYWHWSGGFAQYVSWATGSKIPYPASWDPIEKRLTNGSFDDFVEFTDQFYKNPAIYDQICTMFKNHIKTIVNRVNSISGLPYKNDPTIFSWELANEPQFPSKDWVDDISGFIKSLDGNHLVTVGLESRFDETEFLNAHQSTHIDYCTIHIWAQNRGIYNMLDPSRENIDYAINWALKWVDKGHEWATLVKKPLILEEFGMPRDNFNNPKDIYSPMNPTTRRDEYFEAVLKRVATLCDEYYSGFGFWAYSGVSRPGDEWIGDPPHEAPGWYGLYNTDDSTFKVMADAYQKMIIK